MKLLKNNDGVIALEACLSLSVFMFLVLLMYNFIIVFEAQYTIEHAMLETGKSLAIESYATNKIIKADSMVAGDLITQSGSIGTIAQVLGLTASVKNKDYIAFTKWYNEEQDTQNVTKKRFYAYLAGDKDKADVLLRRLRVENGAAGLNFSGTKVENGDLYIHVTFKCKMLFDYAPFGLGEITLNLMTRNALWK